MDQNRSVNSLSGLPDGNAYRKEAKAILKSGESVTFLQVVVTHLKKINREFGDDAGDIVIRGIAERLSEWGKIFSGYRVFHVEGVRFVAVVFGETEPDPMGLSFVLGKPVRLKGKGYKPKCRIVSLRARQGDTLSSVNELLRYVSAKEELLPKQVIIIDEKLHDEFDQIEKVTNEIRIANKKESYEIYYQPVFDIRKKRYVSAEALIRLRGSDGKPVSPGLFIPIAEKKRLINRVSDLVLKKVCCFLGKHPDLKIDSISINLTPEQIVDEDLPEKLDQYVKEYGTDLSRIRLEMTERTIQQNPRRIIEVMEKMNQAGSGFYLDDFGTGYSNLSSVISMPFEAIKLDKSLNDRIGSEKEDQMIGLLVKMIHIGKAKIIAEGLETQDQISYGEENGFDRIQGYYYSKPLPEAEFLEFIRENN